MVNITTTDVEARTSGIKVLVYGRAGMGKTVLCGTAPKPLIISAEAGLMSLRHKRIPVITVNNIKDVWDALTWCQSSKDARHIETVCLDSISEIAEVCLANEKKQTRDPRQAYGELATQMVTLVKAFRDLPKKNVVVTCKEGELKNEALGTVRSAPKAPGQQLGPELPYLFDEVFYIHTVNDSAGKRHHVLRTQPTINIDAKDRSGVLDEIEYPDLNNVFTKIRGSTQ